MAKLNDPPPPPAESIDALKRRFIRQNREIARVNSVQSQRIRNLEIEISRLVAENISLREQAISAQAEAERWRTANSVNMEILDLKERLQRKVEEVGELIGEMGRIPERAVRKGRRKSRLMSVGERMSTATEQEWRNRQSMREALAEERGELKDGRLPAIREDKLYPRRTLENTELTALREEAALQQASESPELGPPPVAHFDVVGEVMGLDSARTSEDENGGEEVMQLPSILERRRKRRTSALLQTMPTEEQNEEESEGPPEPQDVPMARANHQLLKSGAKRKLDVSELDAPILQRPPNENDDFVFQRRQEIWNSTNAAGKKASRFIRAPGRENATVSETEAQSPQKSVTSTRKILAPKSTNSPAKRRIHVSEKLKDEREEQPKQAAIKPTRRNNPPPQIETEKIAQTINGQDGEEKNFPPKTPAAEADGILSPVSTEPSARNAHQAKEAAVLNSVEDVLNGSIGRGSRRTRPAVSYAEPNLRDKMRRPGKELVGAVEGLERNKENPVSIRGTSMDRAKSEDVKTNEDQCKVINVKQEEDTNADGRWKVLPMRRKEDPASPLRNKERKERPDADSQKTADSRKHDAADDLEQAIDRLSIFDPPVSSPAEEPKHSRADKEAHETLTGSKTTRQKPSASDLTTRRHSIQPPSSSSSLRPAIDGEPSDLHVLPSKRRSSTAQAPLPRPNSAASLRGEQMANIAKDLKRSKSVSSNLKTKDSAVSDAGMGTSVSSRAERTLNRRRSMMV